MLLRARFFLVALMDRYPLLFVVWACSGCPDDNGR